MSQKWGRCGNMFARTEEPCCYDQLPVGIYTIDSTEKIGLFLTLKQERFKFDYKLYGSEPKFAERVKVAYDNTKENLGVLFTGIRGTGKTVTAELICNALNLPVVVVGHDYKEKLIPFLNSIDQDVIFFFDEFEKIFPVSYNENSKLLPIMDGVLRNKHRKIFLLTTNSLNVEESLLSRPGRIRYLKTYGNLPVETIIEIVDDKLVNKKHRNDLIEFISKLELITVDIVSSLTQETNIFDEPPQKFASFFNVRKSSPKNDVYKLVQDNNGEWTEKSVKYNAKITPEEITEEAIQNDDNFYIGSRYIGQIMEIKEGGNFIVKEMVETPDGLNEVAKLNTYRVEKVDTSLYNYRTYVST